MLPRADENKEAALLLADEDQSIQSTVLPKDVWNHLLQFCTLESIGRLARVDKNLNAVVKNAKLNKEFEAKVMLMSHQRITPGYVKGSYTNLKAFFAARQNDAQRVEKLNNSCCIDSADCCLACGLVGTAFFMVTGAASVWMTILYCSAKADVVSVALFGGLAGCFSFGPVSLCVTSSIKHRDKERKNLNAQLQSVPVNLHGTLFSWQPANAAADLEPARLAMN